MRRRAPACSNTWPASASPSDDMAEAERRGRLFGLAGDALLQSGPQTHTLRTAAESIGVPVAEVEHAWAILGLTAADVGHADAESRRRRRPGRPGSRCGHNWATMPRTATCGSWARSVARLAEAVSSMIRTSAPRLWLGHTGDELATAQAYREVAGFVPRVGAMIDAIHRHHLVSTRTFIEGMQRGPSAGLVCGVGFADLSGFTALTQTLTPAELSALLSDFGTAPATWCTPTAGGW